MVMTKNKNNSIHGVICVFKKFPKTTSGFTLIEEWEAGNYHIIFWSVMSKAEFSSERPDQFIYLFHFLVKYGGEVFCSYVN